MRYLSLCELGAVVSLHELAQVCAVVERELALAKVTRSDYGHIQQGPKTAISEHTTGSVSLAR